MMHAEITLRSAILAEAHTWIGTRYHANGAVKGVGVDCGRFPLAVYRECGLPVPERPPHWPSDWFLHEMAESEPYLELILGICREVDRPYAGDLALFRMGRAWAHTAIVIDWPEVIHTRGNGGNPCVEIASAAQAPLAKHAVRFFRSNRFFD